MYSYRLKPCIALVLTLAAVSTGFGQAFYSVGKEQNFIQTAASGAVPNPLGPVRFEAASSAAGLTLALPSGATVPLATFLDFAEEYRLRQGFASKAALDAAYPAGVYRLSGAGIPTLSFNLANDLYPTATPQIVGGTWSAGGLLVLNPAQANTITFSNFTGYATPGVAGHIYTEISGQDVSIDNEVTTIANPFGIPVSSTPLTTVTIPANRLTAGRIYSMDVIFDTFVTADFTTVPNSAAITGFSNKLNVYIVAQAAGTTLPAAPVITTQPQNVSVAAGGRAVFTAGVNNAAIGFSSWFVNGAETDGVNTSAKYAISANGLTLTVNNVTAADAGSYAFRVIGPGGIVTSTTATLTVTGGAPAIARQPAPATVSAGSTAVFSVNAANATGYQWRLNGTNIAGATGATLVVQNAAAAQAGSYTVVITGAGGTTTTSAAAALTVAPATADAGRLINLSILTPLSAGESMTMGTVIGGGGTSGNKPLLARAAGPSLAPLGVSPFLPDPTMTLNFTTPSPAVVVASNNDWAGTSALSSAFVSVGAFAYVNATSKDAAIFQQSLAPGNYTVQVSDAGSGTGTVIAELYDATPGGSFTATTPRLINVSVLKQIGTGSSLTAGFVIGGTTAKTVLIRAVGPTLTTAFNITGAMADPQLTLTSTSVSPNVIVATNNDWAGDPAITQTATRVGAFAVANAASKDAMVLVTLAPGNYTAQVSPLTGTTGGTAIVEVYDVP